MTYDPDLAERQRQRLAEMAADPTRHPAGRPTVTFLPERADDPEGDTDDR